MAAAESGADVAGAWEEFSARLRAFFRRRVGEELADELTQDAYLKLATHRDDVAEENVAAWLFTVGRNAVLDVHRRPRPVTESLDGIAAEDEDDSARADLARCADAALALLPEESAMLLRRVDLEGESQRAVARETGLGESALKSRVQRARRLLRERIERCCRIETDAAGRVIDMERRGPESCDHC